MAYDPELADRIRWIIGRDPDLTETKMFGGLAFLIAGNMAIAASSQGGALVRVGPHQSEMLLATTTASLAQMRGRPMPGWLRVAAADLRTDDQLTPWVERGTGYARSLPPRRQPRARGSGTARNGAAPDEVTPGTDSAGGVR